MILATTFFFAGNVNLKDASRKTEANSNLKFKFMKRINVFDPNEFFNEARKMYMNKFGMNPNGNATHAYFELKID
jgi:hypothetical protein